MLYPFFILVITVTVYVLYVLGWNGEGLDYVLNSTLPLRNEQNTFGVVKYVYFLRAGR